MKARSVGTFVQIGDMIINMAHVVEFYIGSDEIYLHYTPRIDNPEEEYPAKLRGETREAFLEWWERQAELTAFSPFRIPSPSTCCSPIGV